MPTFKQILARAQALAIQVEVMGQQYDALLIQYQDSRAQVRVAKTTVRRDDALLAADETAVGQIAAAGYVSGGGTDPTLLMLQSDSPQTMLSRSSILGQLQQQDATKIRQLHVAQVAAAKAKVIAAGLEQQAAILAGKMRHKLAAIQAKADVLNSAVYAQALQQLNSTGVYPNLGNLGNSLEVKALNYALSKRGSPYVWGAAGPSSFDCSGLVVWAYAQVGIYLPHYTGDLWNSGVHVSESQLRPGDLVFFFAGISHVGIFVGNGYMLDAPFTGAVVRIEPIYWSAFVGAVRIV